ncbi:MAG: anthranilate phosphoribosyltransferase [Candidatus Dadabacteria bacterium]|nr:MAG: anthranilate phosphoribosyltransferase [Candidatus Dadabacteria bacterium]
MIHKVVEGQDLTEGEMIEAMEAIMGGEATHAQMAAFLTALRIKGETIEEITGAARVMREHATPIRVEPRKEVLTLDRDEINVEYESILDTCGTGGDDTNTFNISTTTALVVAAAGVRVAKHGNRAVSSRCGSADVLEALGVNLDVTPEVVETCIREIGIGFLYAPLLHSAMRHVAPVRREMGIRTIFNVLGPLTNPAGASRQVLGVYRKDLTGKLARVLQRLGSERAFVVHGSDGLDEITITGPTHVAELRNGQVEEFEITPEEFGLSSAPPESIHGGNAQENARIVRGILEGEKGPRRDVVVLNAGAALLVAGATKDLMWGIRMAQDAIDSGRALQKLAQLVEITNR